MKTDAFRKGIFYLLLLFYLMITACALLPYQQNHPEKEKKIQMMRLDGGGLLSDTNADDIHPYLFRHSGEGKVLLFFASDRDGVSNDLDIYMAEMLDDETFKEPSKLGSNVNTADHEYSPIVYESNENIYFRFLRKTDQYILELEGKMNSSNFSVTNLRVISSNTNWRTLSVVERVDNTNTNQIERKVLMTEAGGKTNFRMGIFTYQTTDKIYHIQGYEVTNQLIQSNVTVTNEDETNYLLVTNTESQGWMIIETGNENDRKLKGIILSNEKMALFDLKGYRSEYERKERTPFIDSKTGKLYLSVKYESWEHYNLMRYNKTVFEEEMNQAEKSWTNIMVYFDSNASIEIGTNTTENTTEPVVYNVLYDGNENDSGKAPSDSNQYTNGQTTVVLANTGELVRTGYNFAGWNVRNDGNGTGYQAGDSISIQSSNITLYALWTNNIYTLSYHGNGNDSGAVPASQSGSYQSQIIVSGNTGELAKTGNMFFAGWNTVSNGSGTAYQSGSSLTVPAQNTVLYAQWTNQTYSVVFNANGGSGTMSNMTLTNGQSVQLSSNQFTKSGYTFQNWTNANGAEYTNQQSITMGSSGIYLYAVWSEVVFSSGTWTSLGSGVSVGQVHYVDVEIDSSGNLFAAYKDFGLGGDSSGRAAVKKYNGSSWETLGGTNGLSESNVFTVDMAIDSSGNPYVIYQDSWNTNRATVKKFNGTSWEVVGNAGLSADRASDTCIAFDLSNVPYIAYQDAANGYKATVKKFNGTGWETVGNIGFSSSFAGNLSIAFNSSNIPYIAYRDLGYSYKAVVSKLDGTNWVPVGSETGFSAGEVYHVSSAFDSSDNLYVAYSDYTNSKKATVKKFSGSSWETVGTVGFTAGEVRYTSIAVDSSGVPYLVYSDYNDSQKGVLSQFNGTNWTIVGNEPFSTGRADYTSITINSSDNIFIGYAPYSLSVKRYTP